MRVWLFWGEPEPMKGKAGLCQAQGCVKTATDRTLIGLVFCAEHFGLFYSDSPFPIEPPKQA